MQTENMKSFAIAIVATLGFQLATVPAGHAQNAFQCSETISDGRTINGSVVVPANRICTLTNVTVVGNVQVGTGADLNVSGQGGDGQGDRQCAGRDGRCS